MKNQMPDTFWMFFFSAAFSHLATLKNFLRKAAASSVLHSDIEGDKDPGIWSEQWKKNLVVYRGDYTAQLYRDYNNTIIRILINQPV